jgi:hypothetical protein
VVEVEYDLHREQFYLVSAELNKWAEKNRPEGWGPMLKPLGQVGLLIQHYELREAKLLEQRDKMLLITKSTLCPDCQTSGEFSVGGGYLAGCKFCSERANLINEIEASKQTKEGDIE